MVINRKIIIASILFGLTSTLFSELTHWLKKTYTKLFPNPVVKSFMVDLLLLFSFIL